MQQVIGQIREKPTPDVGPADRPRGAARSLPPYSPSATFELPGHNHRRDSSSRASALWGLSGFVFGAVFWHFIGFWGFVSSVVFNGRVPVVERYVEQTGPLCIELAIDRKTGMTRGAPCAVDASQLDERSSTAKGPLQGPRGKVARGGGAIRLSAGDR